MAPLSGPQNAAVPDEQLLTGVVVSTSIELVNTGVSSVDLVLNNQRYGQDGNPTSPPVWHLNKMEQFHFGKLIRVDMRYLGGHDIASREDGRVVGSLRSGGDAVQGADGWYPVILARITGLDFSFSQDGPATLTVRGEDLLSRLKVHPPDDIDFNRKDELFIINDLMGRVGTGLSLGPPSTPRPTFDKPYRSLQLSKRRTYLKFLRELADDLDWELFAAFDSPLDPTSTVTIRFEPHRSVVAVDADIVDLVWGVNLLDFQPRFEFWRQFTEVHAGGRSPWGGRLNERVQGSIVSDYLHADGDERLQTAPQIRADLGTAEGIGSDNIRSIQVTNLDGQRAEQKAKATLLTQARKFLTAEVQTLGMPTLRPGIHVAVHGLYAPFDGLYYVDKVRHTLDDSGFKSLLTLSRPGYADPATYPGAS